MHNEDDDLLCEDEVKKQMKLNIFFIILGIN